MLTQNSVQLPDQGMLQHDLVRKQERYQLEHGIDHIWHSFPQMVVSRVVVLCMVLAVAIEKTNRFTECPYIHGLCQVALVLCQRGLVPRRLGPFLPSMIGS